MATVWIGCAAGNFRAGRPGSFRPEAIVIHIMEGSLAGTDSWFNDNRAQVSAHYGIGKNGDAHQYVKETDTAFHAGVIARPDWPLLKSGVNPNFYTIGIEHEGRGDAPWPWPPDQLNASFDMVADIASRWGIALDDRHIVPHHRIRATKTCPGSNFDLSDYMRRLSAHTGGASPTPFPTMALSPALKLRVVASASLHKAPRLDSAITAVLAAVDTFSATAIANPGQEVGGNALWYANAAGEFLWAGSTDRPSGV